MVFLSPLLLKPPKTRIGKKDELNIIGNAIVTVYQVLPMYILKSVSNVSNTKDRVWPDFQTPRGELKIRRAVKYF